VVKKGLNVLGSEVQKLLTTDRAGKGRKKPEIKPMFKAGYNFNNLVLFFIY